MNKKIGRFFNPFGYLKLKLLNNEKLYKITILERQLINVKD